MSEPKITLLNEFPEDGRVPSKFFCINAIGQYIFFSRRSRADAQKDCDELYGKNFYSIKVIQHATVR